MARIMEAAVREFAMRGHEETYLPAIARRAGVAQHQIHNHFGDKARLHAAVLRRVRDEVRSLAVPPPNVPDPIDGMAVVVRAIWHVHVEHPAFLALLEAPDPGRPDQAAVLAGVREDGWPFLERIEALLRSGAATGAFRSGVDPLWTYLSILALGSFQLSHQSTLSALYGRDLGCEREMDAWIDHVVAMVLASVRQA